LVAALLVPGEADAPLATVEVEEAEAEPLAPLPVVVSVPLVVAVPLVAFPPFVVVELVPPVTLVVELVPPPIIPVEFVSPVPEVTVELVPAPFTLGEADVISDVETAVACRTARPT